MTQGDQKGDAIVMPADHQRRLLVNWRSLDGGMSHTDVIDCSRGREGGVGIADHLQDQAGRIKVMG